MTRSMVAAEKVAVIVVPDDSPAGACAHAIPTPRLASEDEKPCFSTVHDSEPPETELRVTVLLYHETPTTTKPPTATAEVVVKGTVEEDVDAPKLPRAASERIATAAPPVGASWPLPGHPTAIPN